MQEDKTSKWLASELRKRQEEDPLPYELGAWEAFEAKRAAVAKKKTAYWLSGIAATLALLLVAGGLWIAQDASETGSAILSDQIALEQKADVFTEGQPRIAAKESPSKSSDETLALNQEQALGENRPSSLATPKSDISSGTNEPALTHVNRNQPNLASPSDQPSTQIPERTTIESDQAKRNETLALQESGEKRESNPKTSFQNSLITSEEPVNEAVISSPDKKEEANLAALPSDPEMSEEEIKEILETKSFARLAMGVSPGFGASQNSEMATSGSTVGLGLMVDMEVTGKLVMGSGVAVNYLNQTSESQSYNTGGGFYAASAVTETEAISQVQVDIPLYVKYPITRNQAVSVQAGFSNLITFNQSAAHESSYTRQVAVMDAQSSNSFALKSEAVSISQDLSVPSQRFYPLATANFGVNIRVFESKKTSYEVMPFYNYPLQEFSGYGQKLGMFGASFKVNFGAIQKK